MMEFPHSLCVWLAHSTPKSGAKGHVHRGVVPTYLWRGFGMDTSPHVFFPRQSSLDRKLLVLSARE